MQHTVEIADTAGTTMQLTITAETLGWGGSWRAITKGMIKHNSGAIGQAGKSVTGLAAQLLGPDGTYGVQLDNFISLGTVNDQGTGSLLQPWAIGLKPGVIEWSVI